MQSQNHIIYVTYTLLSIHVAYNQNFKNKKISMLKASYIDLGADNILGMYR